MTHKVHYPKRQYFVLLLSSSSGSSSTSSSSSRSSSRVLFLVQFEEAEARVRSCREVVVQSLESAIEECLEGTLRVDDFTESLRK